MARTCQKFPANFPAGPIRVGDAFDALWTPIAPYLGSNLAETAGPETDRQRPRKQEVTLLFADIRGFMSIAESMDPEECVRILNRFFSTAVSSVTEFSGIVDKFQGDGIMAVFFDMPEVEPHPRRAVRCAMRLREAIQSTSFSTLPAGFVRLGMGISTGIAAVGSVGAESRRDYTAVGDVVNVAHRLQSISLPDQILVCAETRMHLGNDTVCHSLGRLKLRGRIAPVTTYAIL